MSMQEHLDDSPHPKVAIAAIDFGTTNTGCAFYLKKDTDSYINIHDINTDQAWVGSSERGLQAPTSILLYPDKTFHSFGFEAEAKFKSLSLEEKHRNWYFFRYFKMKLHSEEHLTKTTLLEDWNGKTMSALTVFEMALRYVKKHLMSRIQEQMRGEINVQNIQWVITVPAIWRHSAKQFMRQAATLAGIRDEQLLLALEPESAAICCKELAVNKAEGVDGIFLKNFDPGEKYIVLDLGGGTVDTTVHEVLDDGSLMELYGATGGPWGGQLVNEAFEKFIETLVTPTVFKTFCKRQTSDWIDLQRAFEKEKRSFYPTTEQINLNFPVDLETMYEKQTHQKLETTFSMDFNFFRHTLILNPEVMNKFYTEAADKIIKHIEFLLRKKELKNISSILLVGGFSESTIIRQSIIKHFRNMSIVAPESGGSSILKGAVLFGYSQRIISVRVSPFSYGVHTRKPFDPSKHPQNRMLTVMGKYYVDNAFDKHIEKMKRVNVGDKTTERKYIISNRGNPSVYWNVYQSTSQDPEWCNEEGCSYIGRLHITVPRGVVSRQVKFGVSMTCKGTELEATASCYELDAMGRWCLEPSIRCTATLEFLEADYTIGSEVIGTTCSDDTAVPDTQ